MTDLVAPIPGEIIEIARKFRKGLYLQKFTLPSGKNADWAFWEGERGRPLPVMVFALTQEREVIYLRQYRFGALEFILEVPGGCADSEGESAEETILREFDQETGYKPGRVEELVGCSIFFEPAALRTAYRAFLATDCIWVHEPEFDEFEIAEVLTAPFPEWLAMIQRGEVRDDKNHALTLLAGLKLGLLQVT